MNRHLGTYELIESQPLNFLWLELTNKCNLECLHCYADSSPSWEDTNPLTTGDYIKLLKSSYDQGCRAVQFIGGEPTLNKGLPELLESAHELGFSYIEVYTNLLSLKDSLIDCIRSTGTRIATSIYSSDPEIHDEITTRPGSLGRTVENIKKLVELDITVRASFIEMDSNKDAFESTKDWLIELGVENIGFDQARQFGRANTAPTCDMGELCGECAKGTLCVDPEGSVSPCIMSKTWGIGNLHDTPLDEILDSELLKSVRKDIFDHTSKKQELVMGGCNPSRPNDCGPNQGGPCNPCAPNGICGPNKCQPTGG